MLPLVRSTLRGFFAPEHSSGAIYTNAQTDETQKGPQAVTQDLQTFDDTCRWWFSGHTDLPYGNRAFEMGISTRQRRNQKSPFPMEGLVLKKRILHTKAAEDLLGRQPRRACSQLHLLRASW
jgi:hypothetical protein